VGEGKVAPSRNSGAVLMSYTSDFKNGKKETLTI
jgi:hypothetical protein